MVVLSERGWGRQQGVEKVGGNFCSNHCTEEETKALFFFILLHFLYYISCLFFFLSKTFVQVMSSKETRLRGDMTCLKLQGEAKIWTKSFCHQNPCF